MFNKAIITGRLGQDPEVRYTQDGTAVTNLSMATSETYKDKEGSRQEKTEWHKVVVWGKQAENVAQYLGKGRLAQIEGKLQTRSYDKDGETRYVTEIKASNVIFLPSSNGSGQTDGEPAGGGGDDDDDIPF